MYCTVHAVISHSYSHLNFRLQLTQRHQQGALTAQVFNLSLDMISQEDQNQIQP